MRKFLTVILVLALVLCVGAASAFAAGPARNDDTAPAAASSACPSGHMDCVFTDADSDGVCDNRADCGNRQGANFADADGDGVCDNRADCGNRQGANFADADGDGVCDNQGSRGAHHGGGHGHHGGRRY